MVNILKNMSSEGESDDGVASNINYKKKCHIIIQRCETIQKENERLVHRIHSVKRILKRKQKERKFLMLRLDSHGDRWRHVQMPYDLNEPSPPKVSTAPSNSHQNQMLPKPKTNSKVQSPHEKPKKTNSKSGSSSTSHQTKKTVPSKVDKNAPKRPGNPYLQFCQEQRSSVIEEMASIGQTEPSKIEVTKHLANKWNTLTLDDKKIYYDMYKRSKEKWTADMELYTLTKGGNETNS